MNEASDQTAAESAPGPLDPSQDLTGQVLAGDFRLLRGLGLGGMGHVYLAEQLSLKRKVALKVLRPEVAGNAAALKRFEQEAKAVARATHANIVQVYATGEDRGVKFMALEYVEGRNLRDYLEKKGPPEVLAAIGILRQVASALERAGELGVIHRDIKPENILLTRKGEVKVADFGLSRVFGDDQAPLHLTQTGVSMGTPLYMSPEQVEGRPVDPRTDIYSLGVTAYHLLSGEPPFRGQTAFEVAVQHVQKEPAPLAELRPDLPPGLCALVHKMLAKKPEDRYQAAAEIVRDLGRLRDALVGLSGSDAVTRLSLGLSSSDQTATLAPAEVRTGAQRRSRWARAWVAASLVLTLAAGWGVGQWVNARQGQHLQELARREVAPPDPLQAHEAELERTFEHLARWDDTDRGRQMAAMIACIDLGTFYVKHRKLAEADRFFQKLDQPEQPRQLRSFGKLGAAVVLAHRDETRSSYEAFADWLVWNRWGGGAGVKKGPLQVNPEARKALLVLSPEVREMVATALLRNKVNDPAAFPPQLEFLLEPPRAAVGEVLPVPREGKKGAPPAKGGKG